MDGGEQSPPLFYMFEKRKKKDFFDQAVIVLKQMQKRDYAQIDKLLDMAKDEIITDLSFGRLALQIPVDHYEVVSLMFPDIQNPDAEIKTLAWKGFMASEYSIPYKVNTKQRAL